MKKFLKKLLMFVLIIPFAFLFTACGNNGLSAYEIAVKNGFVGTEAEWLESLKGDAGKNGTNGADGESGSDALSSYAIWQEAYDNGDTTLDYVEWLKANFEITINPELYAINKNLLSVVEVKCYNNENGVIFNNQAQASGSGVIYKIAESGDVYVVTNYHVVYSQNPTAKNDAYPFYRLEFYGQDSFHYMPATFIGGTSTYDVAVLKIEAEDFIDEANAKPVTLAKSPVVAGTPVIAIGNTNAAGINISGGVMGVVDVESEEVEITIAGQTVMHRVIRHDAYITNGNSGGGLFDLNGDFVGITNGGQRNNEKINYAIPTDLVQKVANQLIENFEADSTSYKLKLTKLGITNFVYDKFSSFNDETKLVEVVEKFRVSAVEDESAFFGELIAGNADADVYISAKINGREIKLSREYMFDDLAIELRANDTLTFVVKRVGEANPVEISATITAEMFEEIA